MELVRHCARCVFPCVPRTTRITRISLQATINFTARRYSSRFVNEESLLEKTWRCASRSTPLRSSLKAQPAAVTLRRCLGHMSIWVDVIVEPPTCLPHCLLRSPPFLRRKNARGFHSKGGRGAAAKSFDGALKVSSEKLYARDENEPVIIPDASPCQRSHKYIASHACLSAQRLAMYL